MTPNHHHFKAGVWRAAFLIGYAATFISAPAQTLFVPSGTSGIGSSANGNVGVGTSSPANELEVRGIARFSNGTDYGWIFSGSSGGLNAFHVGSFTNVPLAFFTNASAPKALLDTAGNLGIGTTAPAGRLDVVGDGSNPTVINARSRQTNTYLNLTAGSSDDAVGEISFERTGAGAGNIYIGGNATGNIIFRSAGYAYKMQITAAGNVGIGTWNPTHKLAVNGTVRAKEVIVDTGWADHVFATGYRLASLSEVEQHIRKQGRLPDVPSAAEVAAHGVSVGDVQRILLQKIEELTLHVIAQQKLIAEQGSRLAALEREAAQAHGDVDGAATAR